MNLLVSLLKKRRPPAEEASKAEVEEKQAEQKAGERFLRKETPTAMLEVATKDSERMQAEDDKSGLQAGALQPDAFEKKVLPTNTIGE